jgi:undecaprenyl-diphosphatase
MPDWIAVVLLGLVEGLTEFLPVSSTGHLLLAEQWLPEQTDLFNIVIQCGAVLAVLFVFWKRVWELCVTWKQPASRDYALKLALAFFITSVGCLIADARGYELPKSPVPVAVATLVGGLLILVIERWLKERGPTAQVSWPAASVVGLAQILAAIFPGTSRSGATILAALAFGVRRPAATEFSFLLGIPSLFAASGLKLFSHLRKSDGAYPVDWGLLLLGFSVAAASAFVVVRWLLRFVQTHTFNVFGWYRIALGSLILLWWWSRSH